ncbi:unnamed protein product, partial [Scytosiphon promiscuus]
TIPARTTARGKYPPPPGTAFPLAKGTRRRESCRRRKPRRRRRRLIPGGRRPFDPPASVRLRAARLRRRTARRESAGGFWSRRGCPQARRTRPRSRRRRPRRRWPLAGCRGRRRESLRGRRPPGRETTTLTCPRGGTSRASRMDTSARSHATGRLEEEREERSGGGFGCAREKKDEE